MKFISFKTAAKILKLCKSGINSNSEGTIPLAPFHVSNVLGDEVGQKLEENKCLFELVCIIK